MVRPHAAKHGRVCSLGWALAIAAALLCVHAVRWLSAWLLARSAPPLWAAAALGLLTAAVTVGTWWWAFSGAGRFVARALRPGRALLATAGLGGLLGGVPLLAGGRVAPAPPVERGPGSSAAAELALALAFALLGTLLGARLPAISRRAVA